VLDTDRKGLQEAFQNREDGGIGVFIQEGTTSRAMAADWPYGEFCDFYSVIPEYFGYNHVFHIQEFYVIR
jgi:hypothetical protein